MEYILSVKNLKTDFADGDQVVHAVDDVSFDIRRERLREERNLPLPYRSAEREWHSHGRTGDIQRTGYYPSAFP